MSITADFNFTAIGKKGIEAGSSVSLNESGEILQKQLVSLERLIGREVEDGERILSIAKVDSHFSFPHFFLELSILDFYFCVIGLDNFRGKDFALEPFVEGMNGQRGSKDPVAQGRARNGSTLSFVYLLKAIKRRKVAKFADNGVSKQASARQSLWDWRAGLFRSDDMPFTFRTGAHFLLVLYTSKGLRDSIKLVSNFITYGHGVDDAVRTLDMARVNSVGSQVSREIFIQVQYMFRMSRLTIIGFCIGFELFSSGRWCWSRIMLFGLPPEVTFIACFNMGKENVELVLQIGKLLLKFCIALQSFLKKLSKALIVGESLLIFSSQPEEFFLFGG